ncbi:hypothetical protein QBC34DRAFT_465175 [Podospora aff. communis PSN243]|uniref:Uncharacterized protein n=1 Tax=Podospora aff. communis PSN243 TaxID=3040156 RepID=A0AAV9H375_9PEZI|nr:hypothetical protein QBC34DRAFT_465175 [Podospora aff. communis PSN243]
MQLSLKPVVLFALPIFSAASALPAEIDVNSKLNTTVGTNAQFHVNSRNRDLWVENGLSRWRTVFSAEGIDPSTYCRYWTDPPGEYWKCLDNTRNLWIRDYGCTTG